jgi:FkbM family methyltransferase
MRPGALLDRKKIMNNAGQEQLIAQDERNSSEPSLAVFKAPDGREFFHHAAAETKYVYQEIFGDRVYLRHGINLVSGESLFDIGANIGLFTLFVKEHFKDVKVYAFEPSPEIFCILKANVARYDADSVSVYNCGIAAREGEAKFTFYPGYSIMSAFHANVDQDRETLRTGIRSQLLEKGLDPAEIQNRFLDKMVENALGSKREHLCQLRAVSDIIDENEIDSIGLLKIDAEGSELDILAGIRDEHWARIRQIVMEIHDPAGTACPQARKLLEDRGYICSFEQEKRLSGSGIVNCYARRG